jgi:prevent-host-death family protein
MWTQMGIRQLRDNLTEAIRRVRAGETIEVTHDGVAVAVLSPAPRGRIERLVAVGDVSPAKPLRQPVRRFAVTGEKSATEALEDDRADA